jgi:hypothetical protein
MAKGALKKRTEALRERLRKLPRSQPLSRVLLLFTRYEMPPTRFENLRDALADRGIAALLLLVSAFNTLPLPPGSSLITGIPCLMLSWQLMLRRKAVWLPQRVLDHEMAPETVSMLRKRVVPKLAWVEKWVKPRYWPLAEGQDEFIIGLVCIVMAILLILPIPLGNWSSAFAMVFMALALLQRDGIMLLIGFTAAAIALGLCIFVVGSAFFLADSVIKGDLPHFVKEFLGFAHGR